MNRMSVLSTSLLATVALTSAACSDSTAPAAGRNVSLSFSTQAAGAPRSARSPLMSRAEVTVASAADTLIITRVQLVLGEIELKSSLTTTCASERADDSCEELSLGPVLVDLPLTPGATASSIAVAIPAGSYREMEFELDAVSSGEPRAAEFLAANPGFGGLSVRVQGTYRGQPFVYTSRVDAEMELEFATPMVVSSTGGANVTVQVDVARWFRNGSGALLDPTSSANAGTIDENIKLSFDAFEDDDRNGRDD